MEGTRLYQFIATLHSPYSDTLTELPVTPVRACRYKPAARNLPSLPLYGREWRNPESPSIDATSPAVRPHAEAVSIAGVAGWPRLALLIKTAKESQPWQS